MTAHSLQEATPAGRTRQQSSLPDKDLERDQVRSQLQRILSSTAFHNCKRYAAVLKYVVDQTLEGFGDHLKERTIGIEVFDRPPDYDTATDHAVRSAVAEVRKRLAQYYLANAQGELRIEIQPGSYTPQFRWPDPGPYSAPAPSAIAAGQSSPIANQQVAATAAQSSRLRPVIIIAACVTLVAAVIAVLATWRSASSLDSFWNPIVSSNAPVLLCIGNVEGGQGSPGQVPEINPALTLRQFHNSPSITVNEFDAFTLAKFAGLMRVKGKKVRFASQSDATFTDLQNGPTILVGLLNNSWTERLVPKLRFTVEEPTADRVIIRDRNNPSNNDWSIDYSTPYLDVTKDYALVLRMIDPKTEQSVVVAAGITVFGTSAAGDFLTNENDFRKLAAVAPAGWENKNMQIVLSTDVIRGRSGPASIVAAQFW